MVNNFKNIYCDMDGVLANFDGATDALNRFRVEKGFFATLEPIMENVDGLRQLVADGKNVYILSASPNKQADGDKRKWLAKYCPFIKKSHIIICRVGDKKLDYMKTRDGLLFDDWSKNGREWLERDGNGFIKIDSVNSILKCLG